MKGLVMDIHMLTTIDNPYDPFTQYDQWYEFDRASGYNTPSLLGRLVFDSDELSETDQTQAREDAISEIVEENVLGIYRKVSQQ